MKLGLYLTLHARRPGNSKWIKILNRKRKGSNLLVGDISEYTFDLQSGKDFALSAGENLLVVKGTTLLYYSEGLLLHQEHPE